MRIVVAGGGSGGHLIPLLAVVERLRQRVSVEAVVVCGRRQAETKAALLFKARKTLSLGTAGRTPLQRLFHMVAPLFDSELLRAVSFADAVVTSGSYAAVAPTLLALLQRRPLFLVEPNATPGKFSRSFGRFCRLVFRGWKGGQKVGHELVTGVPLREGIGILGRSVARRRLGIPKGARVLLVLGGSQGSRVLNGFLLWLAPRLKRLFPALWILHAAGKDAAMVQAAYRRLSIRASVVEFCERIWEWYSASDAVICRAGASTCAEVVTYGLSTVFVPHPGAGEHQKANAVAALRETYGTVVSQDSLTLLGPSAVIAALRAGRRNPTTRHLNAASTIAEKMIETLYGGVAA